MNNEDYWLGKVDGQERVLFGRLIKRTMCKLGLMRALSFVFSTRLSDDFFIKKSVGVKKNILDVACGGGNSVLAVSNNVTGVDIKGFSEVDAIKNGYKQVFVYSPPDYLIETEECFSAVTCVDLNAHVDPETFCKIINNALHKVADRGRLVLICELDNHGFSYRMFKRNLERYKKYVYDAGHVNFELEESFLEAFFIDHPNLKLVYRKPLVMSFVPFLHYIAFLNKPYLPYKAFKYPALFFDLILGIVNSVMCLFMKGKNKCFKVGYVFEVNKD